MRKTTALLSASTLGIVAVAAGAAAPASADIITGPRCETFDDHLALGSADPSADWYMECVPQYGIGKAEFTLEAPDSGFPEGFDPEALTRTNSPDASGVAPYYDGFFGDEATPLDSWIMPLEVDEATATDTSVEVGATLVAPVVSVGRLEAVPALVAAECELETAPEGAESVAFVSTFAPVTTTFSFVGADGVTYSAPVTATPDPTYYVFTSFTEGETTESVVCITDTHQTVVGDPDGGFDVEFVGLITVPPYVWFEGIEGELADLPNLGVIPFAAPAAVTPAAAPTLADSGAENVVPLGIAAGVLGGLGALLFAFSRRRRTEG